MLSLLFAIFEVLAAPNQLSTILHIFNFFAFHDYEMKISFAILLAAAGTALAQYRDGESDPSVCPFPPAEETWNVRVCYKNRCAKRPNCPVARPCPHPYEYTSGTC